MSPLKMSPLKMSHTFSIDHSGVQTCLQHEIMLVLAKPLGVNTCSSLSLILLYLVGLR